MRFIALFIAALFISQAAHASVQSDVTLWLQLRDGKKAINFESAHQFLKRRPDWPQAELIRSRAEHLFMDTSPSVGQILDWFDEAKPLTDRGRLSYWQALRADGNMAQANLYLKEIWRAGNLDRNQQQIVIQISGKSLKPEDHRVRVDTLLWQGNLDRVSYALRYAGGKDRAVGQARIYLQRFSTQAPGAVSALSANQKTDNGILFDRVRYTRQKGDDDFAVSLLGQRREEMGEHAPKWWRERAILARRALERNDFARAYKIASAHGTDGGLELAEAEWMAGWLATTRLNNPSQGYKHFERMYDNVKTSLSSSRAAYWAGVALEQMGQKEKAGEWYGLAAQHMHTFYGQMAAYALGDPSQYYAAFFKRSQSAGNGAAVPSDIAEAARILYRAGRDEERDLFLRTALNKLATDKKPQALIALAKEVRSPKMALAAAKAAYENGLMIRDALFPETSPPRQANLEKSLTLGIIRQESMFDRYAVSPAGARGLMQLMPGTASDTARKVGVAHRNATQLFEPTHNMQLGQAYLAGLLDRYDGFIPLAAAAYNAGPGNVDKWLAQMGDPRQDPRSWVDWVERIPFYETRNYVQRVWEAYSLYKAMN